MRSISSFLKYSVSLLFAGTLASCYGPIYPAYASNGYHGGVKVDPIVPVVLGAAAIGGIIYAADKYDNKHRSHRHSYHPNYRYSNNYRYSQNHRNHSNYRNHSNRRNHSNNRYTRSDRSNSRTNKNRTLGYYNP